MYEADLAARAACAGTLSDDGGFNVLEQAIGIVEQESCGNVMLGSSQVSVLETGYALEQASDIVEQEVDGDARLGSSQLGVSETDCFLELAVGIVERESCCDAMRGSSRMSGLETGYTLEQAIDIVEQESCCDAMLGSSQVSVLVTGYSLEQASEIVEQELDGDVRLGSSQMGLSEAGYLAKADVADALAALGAEDATALLEQAIGIVEQESCCGAMLGSSQMSVSETGFFLEQAIDASELPRPPEGRDTPDSAVCFGTLSSLIGFSDDTDGASAGTDTEIAATLEAVTNHMELAAAELTENCQFVAALRKAAADGASAAELEAMSDEMLLQRARRAGHH